MTTNKFDLETNVVSLPKQEEKKLRHTLGAVKGHTHKYRWGWRNYFYASSKDEDLESLVTKGLMWRRNSDPEIAKGFYYHATKAGMEAIGMTKASIKRCLKDE